MLQQLESIKWYLWHGNAFQALNKLQDLEMDLDAAAFESKDESTRKLLEGVEESDTYIERNQSFLPTMASDAATENGSLPASSNRLSIGW